MNETLLKSKREILNYTTTSKHQEFKIKSLLTEISNKDEIIKRLSDQYNNSQKPSLFKTSSNKNIEEYTKLIDEKN